MEQHPEHRPPGRDQRPQPPQGSPGQPGDPGWQPGMWQGPPPYQERFVQPGPPPWQGQQPGRAASAHPHGGRAPGQGGIPQEPPPGWAPRGEQTGWQPLQDWPDHPGWQPRPSQGRLGHQQEPAWPIPPGQRGPVGPWGGQQWTQGPPPRKLRKPLDPAKREEVAQTLLYTVGSAILIAGLVLLVALIFPMSTSLLVYAFALGVTVVSLIFVLMGRSSQAGMVIILIAAALGLSAATASAGAVDVPPVVAVMMATLLTGVVAIAARRSGIPSTLVWLAWLAVAVDVGTPAVFTSVLVGACALLATVGRGWPRHQMGIALAIAFSGFQGAFDPDPTWPAVWLVSTVVLGLWLVHFHPATPAPPPTGDVRRPPWTPPTRGELGGQPWELNLVLLPTAWFVSLLAPGVPVWAPLLLAAIVLLAGVALPEPLEAVNRQGPLRDGMTLMGAFLLSLTLLAGRLDPVVEPLVLMALAIAAQVVPVVTSSRGWLFRAIPAVFALLAGVDAVIAVWGGASELVSNPITILQGILLTILGVTLMVFRHGRINDVLDGVRFVGGLYLSVHGVVLAASLVGLLLGNLQTGFLIGHTLASLGWMGLAAYLALRKHSTTDLMLAAVVALGAATKLVLFDMQNLSGVTRVAAFMGCGAIMVGIAFLRQRRRPTRGTSEQSPQAHEPWNTTTPNH